MYPFFSYFLFTFFSVALIEYFSVDRFSYRYRQKTSSYSCGQMGTINWTLRQIGGYNDWQQHEWRPLGGPRPHHQPISAHKFPDFSHKHNPRTLQCHRASHLPTDHRSTGDCWSFCFCRHSHHRPSGERRGIVVCGGVWFGPPTKNRIVITQSQVYCLLVRKKNMPRLAHIWDF